MPSASPTAGTAPTDCSGRSTQGACRDDLTAWAHTREGRPCLHTTRRVLWAISGRSPGPSAMKVLMVSWEYPPVVIGGLGRHVHHLATALADAGHEVVVLSRRPSGTDPQQPPVDGRNRRGGKGCRRGAGSARVRLRQRHDGVDVGDGAFDGPRRPRDQGRPQPALAPRRRARPRLVGRASRDRAGRILRRSTGFHHSRHRGRPAFRLGIRRRSAGRCTPSSRGWCTNPIRSSRVRHR